MPSGFDKIRFNASERSDDDLRAVGARRPGLRGIGRAREVDDVSFHNDEAAARHYIKRVLGRDQRAAVRGITAADATQAVPDLKLKATSELPTHTRLLRFEQMEKDIPVFGSRLSVELDRERELVDMGGELASVGNVAPIPSLSPSDALRHIEETAGLAEGELEDKIRPPGLTFFHRDEDDTWHLAFFFKKVPAAPASFVEEANESRGHGLGASPRSLQPLLNYLVDAHDGEVLFYYSAAPMMAAPTGCRGRGVQGHEYRFFGTKVGSDYALDDPLRQVRTFDQEGKDLRMPVPQDPVTSHQYDFGTENPAAVSAHVNASRVFDFYNSVLKRNGIDDKGMDLVSIVNCTYTQDEDPPTWHNAVWYDDRMWYGQDRDETGNLLSYSRFLDVIAHELTHGITDHSSELVYKGQSGALNESFSDIFGVIINNWPAEGGAVPDVDEWSWELGPGLGDGGLPLRDLRDPTRTGDPAHMDDFLYTSRDNGGVHTNSNIHNKAAYNMLTATSNGERVFTPRDVALLYYLILIRLGSLAGFQDALEELISVASTYYADPQERQVKIAAITNAYGEVGIHLGA